jgi:hypothetical protein
VALKFCALNMHRGGTSGPSASGARTVRGCCRSKDLTWSLLSEVSPADELRAVRSRGGRSASINLKGLSPNVLSPQVQSNHG